MTQRDLHLTTQKLIAERALSVVDHVPAMLAYWSREERCLFANAAYLQWFGRTREEMLSMTLSALLGPTVYELNQPHIRAALDGLPQTFERTLTLPSGLVRDTLATYTPDIVDGVVHGFFAHVADVTRMKQLERSLEIALNSVKSLESLLSICSRCKRIRDEEDGRWAPIETYLQSHTSATFSHEMCPDCRREGAPQASA